MATLSHEIWMEPNDEGDPLPRLCLSGPDGEDFRRSLGSLAKRVYSFEANSHFEAMNIYNRYLDRGEYTALHPWDTTPYPDEWKRRQENASNE